MQRLILFLPYSEQGDDLKSCLENNDNDPLEALQEHANLMEDCSQILQEVKNLCEELDIEPQIEACDGMIYFSVQDKYVDKFLDIECVCEDADVFEDDEDYNDDDDDDYDDEELLNFNWEEDEEDEEGF